MNRIRGGIAFTVLAAAVLWWHGSINATTRSSSMYVFGLGAAALSLWLLGRQLPADEERRSQLHWWREKAIPLATSAAVFLIGFYLTRPIMIIDHGFEVVGGYQWQTGLGGITVAILLAASLAAGWLQGRGGPQAEPNTPN